MSEDGFTGIMSEDEVVKFIDSKPDSYIFLIDNQDRHGLNFLNEIEQVYFSPNTKANAKFELIMTPFGKSIFLFPKEDVPAEELKAIMKAHNIEGQVLSGDFDYKI